MNLNINMLICDDSIFMNKKIAIAKLSQKFIKCTNIYNYTLSDNIPLLIVNKYSLSVSTSKSTFSHCCDFFFVINS